MGADTFAIGSSRQNDLAPLLRVTKIGENLLDPLQARTDIELSCV